MSQIDVESTKRVKVEESKEIEIKHQNKPPVVQNIEEKTYKPSVSFLSNTIFLANNNNWLFPTEKIEELLTPKPDIQPTMRNLQNENSHSEPTKNTIPVNSPSVAGSNQNDYYDYCSKLFNSKIQSQRPNNHPLPNFLNFDSELISKSLVLQDLFSIAFRRYLKCSKQNIFHNLLSRQAESAPNTGILPQSDVLRSHSYLIKRKNTDVTSNETIETDLYNHLACQSKGRSPIVINKTLPLSSFNPSSKARWNSLLTNITKSHSLEGGYREENNE